MVYAAKWLTLLSAAPRHHRDDGEAQLSDNEFKGPLTEE